MTLDQIRYFLEVAYCRNFSTAAQHLYISQPNLTKYIAAMEKELGTKLFDRTTRKVELTEHGQQLLDRAETLFMPFLRAYEDLQTDISQNRRAIYIGISRDERIPSGVTETIRTLNLEEPHVRYIPTYDTPDNLITGLRNHQYNIIISSDRNARSIAGMEHIKLQVLHMVFAISKHHPMADKPDLTPTDLPDELIFFAMPKGVATSEEMAQNLFQRIGMMINVKLLDAPADVLSCVRACAGAAIIPDLANTAGYDDIRFFPFHDLRNDTAYQSIIWRSDEADPLVLELIERLKARFDIMQKDRA